MSPDSPPSDVERLFAAIKARDQIVNDGLAEIARLKDELRNKVEAIERNVQTAREERATAAAKAQSQLSAYVTDAQHHAPPAWSKPTRSRANITSGRVLTTFHDNTIREGVLQDLIQLDRWDTDDFGLILDRYGYSRLSVSQAPYYRAYLEDKGWTSEKVTGENGRAYILAHRPTHILLDPTKMTPPEKEFWSKAGVV